MFGRLLPQMKGSPVVRMSGIAFADRRVKMPWMSNLLYPSLWSCRAAGDQGER